jgi:hypothetical protein
MISGVKWNRNLTSPNRSKLTSKSRSDDIVNVEISNRPADHIFMCPFHDKIICSMDENRSIEEREGILHKDTYLTEPHLVNLLTIRIDKDSLCRHIIQLNFFFHSKTIRKRVLFVGIALRDVLYL